MIYRLVDIPSRGIRVSLGLALPTQYNEHRLYVLLHRAVLGRNSLVSRL